MAPLRICKVFSGFAPDLQIDLKGPCRIRSYHTGKTIDKLGDKKETKTVFLHLDEQQR